MQLTGIPSGEVEMLPVALCYRNYQYEAVVSGRSRGGARGAGSPLILDKKRTKDRREKDQQSK